MLSHLDLHPDDILKELQRRFNLSGLEEKSSRTK
jgi:phosphoribosyl-ATP pyrophosphohydrolase